MDTITAIIVGMLLFFVIRGAFRGLNGELAPLAGLILAAAVLWFGQPQLNAAVQSWMPDADRSARVFYTALTATGIAIVCFFATALLLRKIIGAIFPQPINAILGALVGAAKAILIVSVVSGLIGVAKDRFKGIREETEANPVSACAARFWAERFDNVKNTYLPALKEKANKELHGRN